jgi:hypothetical protein
MFDAGPEVLHDDIGAAGQPLDDLDAARILQVNRDTSLVAMKIGCVEKYPLLRLTSGTLDSKNVRSKIRENLCAGRAGSNRREIHDGKAC